MRADTVEIDGVHPHAQEPPVSSMTADQDRIIYVAIELSRSTWLVAARLPRIEKPQLYRIAGGDTTALLTLLARAHGIQVGWCNRRRLLL